MKVIKYVDKNTLENIKKNIKDKDVIDVKFAQAISGDEECTTYLPTALLIYKEGE